jgi:hypothetical protein
MSPMSRMDGHLVVDALVGLIVTANHLVAQ